MPRIVLSSLTEDLLSIGLVKEEDIKGKIVKALEAAFKKGGASELKTTAFHIEAGAGPFKGISDARKWLEGILGDALRHDKIGDTKMNLSAKDQFLINSYRDDLRRGR